LNAYNLKIWIIDAGHYHTEKILLPELKTPLSKIFPQIYFEVSYNRFFSGKGNEYKENKVYLGEDNSYYSLRKNIPAMVKFNGKIVFYNINSDENSIQLLELYINNKKFQVRNIPIKTSKY
jgi:hypothetical protein